MRLSYRSGGGWHKEQGGRRPIALHRCTFARGRGTRGGCLPSACHHLRPRNLQLRGKRHGVHWVAAGTLPNLGGASPSDFRALPELHGPGSQEGVRSCTRYLVHGSGASQTLHPARVDRGLGPCQGLVVLVSRPTSFLLPGPGSVVRENPNPISFFPLPLPLHSQPVSFFFFFFRLSLSATSACMEHGGTGREHGTRRDMVT